jgi:hypothetical protein
MLYFRRVASTPITIYEFLQTTATSKIYLIALGKIVAIITGFHQSDLSGICATGAKQNNKRGYELHSFF